VPPDRTGRHGVMEPDVGRMSDVGSFERAISAESGKLTCPSSFVFPPSQWLKNITLSVASSSSAPNPKAKIQSNPTITITEAEHSLLLSQ
jgi:hypothetical protein